MASEEILGLDPGSRVVGYGMIRKNGGSIEGIDFGEIKSGEDEEIPERLAFFYSEVDQLLDEHQPGVVVVEEAFYGPNAKATLRLGQARGALLLAASRKGIRIAEYAPTTIKKSVTGNGSASKEQVQQMVKSLLGITGGSVSRHATDALAAGICFAHRNR